MTTTSEDEVEDAQDRWGYEYERIAGWVYPNEMADPNAGLLPLYRLTSDRVPCGDHFYTTSDLDRRQAKEAGYWDDGGFTPQCTVMRPLDLPSGLRIMIRLYLPWNGDHFYSRLGTEVDDALNIHDYIHDSLSPITGGNPTVAQAFGVYSEQSNRPGLIPLHRLVRTKEWE